MTGIFTDQTCGAACWQAKEPECRCSCGGTNHGIYKRDPGAEQPQRQRSIKGQRYRLEAVTTYSDGQSIVRAGRQRAMSEAGGSRDWWRHPAAEIIVTHVTESQRKWPEFTDQPRYVDYGVWVPIELDHPDYRICAGCCRAIHQVAGQWLHAVSEHPDCRSSYRQVNQKATPMEAAE